MRLAIVLALGLAACAPRPARRDSTAPLSTLRAYSRALTSGDAKTAYSLLSQSARRATSREAFEQAWKRQQPEHAPFAATLDRALAASAPALTERAYVALPSGYTATTTTESGRARLIAPPELADGASDPRELLLLYADALERHDFDALMRLSTARLSAILRAAFAERAAALRKHLERSRAAPTLSGRVHYRDTLYLDLVEDHGRWRVNELN